MDVGDGRRSFGLGLFSRGFFSHIFGTPNFDLDLEIFVLVSALVLTFEPLMRGVGLERSSL